MAKVEVPRSLLIGMAAALGSALLVVVYLLGREAGRTGPTVTSTPPSISRGPVPSGSSPAPPVAFTAEPLAMGKASAPPPGAVTDPDRAAVLAYFAAVDHIAPGQFSGNPEAVAQDMVAGLAKGDASGFDRMIEQSEAARRTLASIPPPAPCAAYHRQSLADLEESLGVLRAMKKALEGSDAGASLAALGERANALRARSEALQREEQALRQRYGLTP